MHDLFHDGSAKLQPQLDLDGQPQHLQLEAQVAGYQPEAQPARRA